MKSLKEISISLNYPSDKDTSHDYLPVYQKEFEKVEGAKILELGVYTGGSLKLWEEFFSNSEIHGVEHTKYTENEMPGIIHWGKYEDVCSDFEDEYFDYIVNDSMHYAKEQIDAFNLYYPKLKPGGKFFMEDIPDSKNLQIILSHLKNKNFYVWDMNGTSRSQDSVIVVVYKP